MYKKACYFNALRNGGVLVPSLWLVSTPSFAAMQLLEIGTFCQDTDYLFCFTILNPWSHDSSLRFIQDPFRHLSSLGKQGCPHSVRRDLGTLHRKFWEADRHPSRGLVLAATAKSHG